MKNILILLILNLIYGYNYGQDKVFTVMAVQGNVAINGKNISPGQQLNSDASVTLLDNAYVGLLHKSGKPVELRTKGVYQLRSYHEKLSVADKGFRDKYMDYVVTGLTDNNNKAYQKNMGVTGSVERAYAQNEIVVPLPPKSVLLDKKFVVDWRDNGSGSGEYDVQLRNMKEELQFFRSRIKGTQLTIDLSDIDLEEEQYYLLTIKDIHNGRKSNTVALYIPTEEERTALQNEIREIRQTLDLNSAVGQVALAEILKNKKLYLDAAQAYERAAELSPEIEYYSGAYNNFVITMVEDDVIIVE